MRKSLVLSTVGCLMVGAFVAGVAVGKGAPEKAKFVAAEELKWDELSGGVKIATLYGDYGKGAYGALLKMPGGYTSALHAHTGTYEAVQISGTSSHWLKGEDGTKAKKMTPGSYWMILGKADHVSACATGSDCVHYISQKMKFDVIPAKEPSVMGGPTIIGRAAAAGAGAGAGPAAPPAAPPPAAAAPPMKK